MAYYRLDGSRDFDPVGFEMVALDESPDVDVPWTMGVRWPEPVQEPIKCFLDPRSGPVMPDIIIDLPLFSDRLLRVLKDAGVRNLDLYDAEVIDRERGKVYANYKAVNIVGRMSCADLERSEYSAGAKPPLMRFSRLFVDENRALGVSLFRLAEDTLFILVAERVKKAVEEAGLVGVRIVPLGEATRF